MIFALGAMSVGLLFLLLLPAVSRRAMRLARRRLEMLLPLSMEEVIAERDLLRAEFAAERRRLEQRMEVQADEHAVELAELGRRATEIVTLQDQLAKLQAEHSALNKLHDTATRDLAESVGERGALATELYDATGLHEAMRVKFDTLAAQHADLNALAEERRAAIAALETKNEALVARVETLERDIEAFARKARNEEERALGLGEERDMVLKEMRAVEQLMASTQSRFQAERDRAAALQETLDSQRKGVDEATAGQREMQKAVDAALRAKEAAEKQAADTAARLAAHDETVRAAERHAADQIEKLKAEIGALKGALEAARAAQATRIDESGLRETLADIGAKVARMAERDVRA
ncbi:MAG: hypothetical protein U1E28_08430 [Beijerinckiaceae bacterium]